MALTATILDEYRLPYAQHKDDLYEHRLANYGLFEAYKEDTPNLLNAKLLSDMKMAQGQTTSIPVINRKDATVTSTRSCTKISHASTSAYVAVTFTTLRTGFHMIPSQYQHNYVGYMDDFRKKMLAVERAFLEDLDEASYTSINAARSTVNRAEDNPYPVVATTMRVPDADKEELFNEIHSIMKYNDIVGGFKAVGSPRTKSLIAHLSNQGSANATNYAYQFNGVNYKYSRNCTVATGDRDTVFFYADGSLGFVPWIDPDSRQNQQSHNVKWSTEYLPNLGLEVGLMYQDGCDDNSTEAGNGFEASKYEGWTWSFDYALVTAYNSDTATYPGTIFKAGISKT